MENFHHFCSSSIFLISFFFLILVLVVVSNSLGQDNEIILTINDEKVTKEEFERIYHKNNSSTAYDNKSVEEYLELFINFKLKVLEAEALGYDTMKSFITELAGYRDQLAKPYLEDKEVTEELLKESYYRLTNQVKASHILIRCDQNASPADTLSAYKKISDIRKRILAGEPFEKLAEELSEDQSAKTNKGQLGWFGAFKMVFPFEEMAYNTTEGEISQPFRTSFGYHILRNEGRRPAKGKIKVAHILFLAQMDDSVARKEKEEKMNECLSRLKNGENFAELVKIYSDDKRTTERRGELNWISAENFLPT
ncbi:MAG: hypothetical protein HC906_09415 [Bacteroidales bacterium]|nr:hypothetical protein [Bacteroidales bacterium]